MRWGNVVLAVALLAGACTSDDSTETASEATTTTVAATTSTSAASQVGAPVTTGVPTTLAASTTTTAAATPRSAAATAVIEPDAIAGIPLGSNKSQAYAVLGPPTTTGQETDLSGKRYDYLRWEFDGNRGLFLNYRTEGVTSPLLTDWTVTAAGPTTTRGVQVTDPASKVAATYGPLQPFCCEARIAEESRGGGRMIIVVATGTQTVRQIIGGDPGYWSRSIAD